MFSITAFVGVGRAVGWEDWAARASPLFSARTQMSAMTPIAGSAVTVATEFIGWLLHQVITEPNLQPVMQTSRLDWLNKMPEGINLMIMSPERSKIQVRSCTSRRHSPGVIPILSASTRRNAETDWYPTVSATASVLIAGFFR